jgi:serine kinase of HPr protein (carbohydrate metabolism regulator)
MIQPTKFHATTVAIDGQAVMITGPSGSGKSDLALRLIDRGAVLVADDYTDVRVDSGVALASSPATIAGLIEVRGAGIITLPFAECAPLRLIIDLAGNVQRLPDPVKYARIGTLTIETIALAAHEASAPIKVEVALKKCLERS